MVVEALGAQSAGVSEMEAMTLSGLALCEQDESFVAPPNPFPPDGS